MVGGGKIEADIFLRLYDYASPGLKNAALQAQLMNKSMVMGAQRVDKNLALVNKRIVGMQFAILGANKALTVGKFGALMGLGGIAASAGPILLMTSAIAQYDKSLTHAAAIGGLTTDQMGELDDQIHVLARTWGLASDDLASGMVELTKAGWDFNEVMTLLEPTALAARGAGIEFGEAANIATFALKIWNREAEDGAELMGKMQFVANSAIIDFNEFGDSLQYVGSAALVAGLGFEETIGAIGAMSQVGQVAGVSSRGMARMMLEMVTNTDKYTSALSAAGVEVDAFAEDGSLNFMALMEGFASLNVTAETWASIMPDLSIRTVRAFAAIREEFGEYSQMVSDTFEASNDLVKVGLLQAESLDAAVVKLKESFWSLFKTSEFADRLVVLFDAFTLSIMSADGVLGPLGEKILWFVESGLAWMGDGMQKLIDIMIMFMQIGVNLLPVLQNFADLMSSGFLKVMMVALAIQKLGMSFGVMGAITKIATFDLLANQIALQGAGWAALTTATQIEILTFAVNMLNIALFAGMIGAMLAIMDVHPAVIVAIAAITIAFGAWAVATWSVAVGIAAITGGIAMLAGAGIAFAMMDKTKSMTSDFATSPVANPTSIYGDVLWRSGASPIGISADDDVLAMKDLSGFGGGTRGGGDTYNVYDQSTEGMRAYLDSRRYGK